MTVDLGRRDGGYVMAPTDAMTAASRTPLPPAPASPRASALEAGRWTDDTSMVLCRADSLPSQHEVLRRRTTSGSRG